MHFVVSTNLARPDPNLCKFIGGRIVMGKNCGKTRQPTGNRKGASELRAVLNPVELFTRIIRWCLLDNDTPLYHSA
ncbi:hypothetical protein F5Y06DRAFT_275503 [Hypoxylon sp. FL0890]|nr:hypothetical protein F5Y06DRAFT_275503 [Hypoxylon sp. FL0890]